MNETMKRPNGRGMPDRREEFSTPRADIRETAEELVLEVDLPGVKAENLDVQFDRGELTVRAKVPALATTGRSWLAVEYQPSDFERVFRISPDVDASKIAAELKNGVLTLHLPRAESFRSHRISVRSE